MPKCLAILLFLLSSPVFAGQAEDQALALINAARAQAGCVALQPDPKLTASALGHARDMAEQDFFDHKGRDGSSFSTRARRQGYALRGGAENIAAGYADSGKTVAQWLGSPDHRKNLLSCRYKSTGLAMYYQADDQPIMGNGFALRAYWVQVFAK